MKYVILIHSNPQPWGHPTSDYIPEFQALPQEQRDRLGAAFEEVLEEMQANGEWVTAQALADPTSSKLYRWEAGEQVVTDGPYSEAKEHLAGFFLIDVDSQERAEQVAARFNGPGETVELRPVMEM
ncbi:YciI family protein [Nocardioides cheoyonin]|uniref:YciI family protein n=1 Tax=Nocardioides cheoyonin TaxID=3156615 RepID=UPI0032B5E423